MHYFIDGYNLLFKNDRFDQDLQKQRQKLISFLNSFELPFCLVFDGTHGKENFSSLYTFDHLTIVYTEKGKTADDYILERLSNILKPSKNTVVTSDKALALKCKLLGANVQTINSFLSWLYNRKTKKKIIHKASRQDAFLDSEKNIERLLKIFEKQLEIDGRN
jgi:uncharacterized protein